MKLRTKEAYAVCKGPGCFGIIFQLPPLKTPNREVCPSCRKKLRKGKKS